MPLVPSPEQVDRGIANIKEVVEIWVLDWLYHVRKAFRSKLFTISRNGLILGGTVSSGSARPQMSKHQNTENKRHD